MTSDDTCDGVKVAQIPTANAAMATGAQCSAWWGGLRTAHRAACHRTLTVESAFDRHRTGSHSQGTRRCLAPETVGLVAARRAYPCWGLPAAPARRRRDSDERSGEMLDAALVWAAYNWPVFPTWGKVPAIPGAHRNRVTYGPCIEMRFVTKDPLRGKCRGGCGRLGHGVWDASCDPAVIEQMWLGPRARCAVSGRIPDKLLMIDIDPRHGGDRSWARLLAEHGPWPECEQHISGRGDGGLHLWVRRPPGTLTDARLAGVESSTTAAPRCCRRLCTTRPGGPTCSSTARSRSRPAGSSTSSDRPAGAAVTATAMGHGGTSVADAYCSSVSWHDVLEPHGWECLDYDGDEDGARWRSTRRHVDSSASNQRRVALRLLDQHRLRGHRAR